MRLLHDNAPAHKARIVTEFLESENVNVLPHPPPSPDLAPYDYSLFPKLKFHRPEKDVTQEMLIVPLFISSSGVCLFRTMNGVFKIGLIAWKCPYMHVESILKDSESRMATLRILKKNDGKWH